MVNQIALLVVLALAAREGEGFPTFYLYAFQFPVSSIDRNVPTPILTPTFAVLTAALVVTCLVVAYSTWVWRLTVADSSASSVDESDEGRVLTGGA